MLAANIPVGVVYQDVYQDIRGQYLNYMKHDIYGVACKGFMTIPYVDTSKITDFGSDADVVPATAGKAYPSIWRKYSFFYFDGSVDEARAGTLLQSDLYGRFKAQGTSLSQVRNVQTVGTVKSCDSRFPKELTNVIQAYPDMSIPSNLTGGLPTELYQFAKDVLTATGVTAEKSDILAAVQSGGIGYVRIELQM